MSEVLRGALRSDTLLDAEHISERLAIYAAFGQPAAPEDAGVLTFGASAAELLATELVLREGEGATEACLETFELLRSVVNDPQGRDRGAEDHLRLLLRTAAFGVLGDAPSQTRNLLRSVDLTALQQDGDWGELTRVTTLAVWLLLIRKDGWDDLDRLDGFLQTLRSQQEVSEPDYLSENDEPTFAAWSLIGSYHLARSAEIIAKFTATGSVDGQFDPIEQAQMHFDRSRDAYSRSGDPELEFLTRLLEPVARRLIANSIWTAVRGAGTRAQRFVETLASRGRPRPILELLPPQRRALMDAGLIGSGRRSIVVSLPTSAGKTLIAEFRILQALDRYEAEQGWVAYTAPTRALVNQVTARLRRDLEGLGIRVERFSPALEVDSVEAEILESQSEDPVRVVVTTPEKLDLLLRGGWTEAIGRPMTLLIVDEAHNLGEGARGLRLELLLATANREHRNASFMLLTPFVPNAAEIAEWLDPTNNESVELGLEWLPNDRIVGLATLSRGEARGDSVITAETLSTLGSSFEAEERISLVEGRPLGRVYSDLNAQGALATATAHSLQHRGSTVTLVQQPNHSWSIAHALADAAAVSTEPTTSEVADDINAVRAVLATEYGESYPLVELLQRGVGVHHAGLSDDVRGMIEALAERNALQHIVATTTLAQGINFPITNVVLASHQYPYGVNMPHEDFWNIAGRAGRADHGEAGIVLLAAPTPARQELLRGYVRAAATELSSTLTGMVQQALARFGELNLERLAFYGDWSAFVQFITHTYRISGSEVFSTQVEQILRGTLGFRSLRAAQPALADQLVQAVQQYTATLAGNPISLVDSTGFSWQTVRATLARMADAQIGEEILRKDLLDPSSMALRNAIGVLLDVPELREQLVERLDASESRGDFLASVVKDWVGGRQLSELANEYFSSGDGVEATKALTRCCQRLFGSILPTVSWGLSALQALALARLDDEPRALDKDLPSYVYYGVDTRDAVALRLFGVPRGAATALGRTWSDGNLTADSLRAELATSTEERWRQALGDVGPSYFRAWRLTEGAA